MEETIRRLNLDYGFGLTEDEIKRIAIQAQEINESFKPLHEIDVTGVAPFQKVDLSVTK
jgi:Asp-tRNA(Asn)/Glu-tRNA(Gln) amidotransferase C subunit